MSSAAHETAPVLFCECARAEIVPEETRRQVREYLEPCGRPVLAVEDLCGLAAARDPVLVPFATARRATVIACFPRAVRWLFHRAGLPLDPDRVQFLNLRTQTGAEIAAAVGRGPGSAGMDRKDLAETENPAWRPWFPVIDYERCTDCGQCREFCLFGVYGGSAGGRVEVVRPEQCKDNCPACARMCPAVAILFPKIDEASPIRGSDREDASSGGKVRLSRDDLFGADALERLRARQRRPPLLR